MQWAATEMPRIRRRLTGTLESLRVMAEEMGATLSPDADGCAGAASVAELYWVTKDMTLVAYDGSEDLPAWTPAAVIPDPVGMLVWAAPLPSLPSTIWGGGQWSASVTGVIWEQRGGHVSVWVMCRSTDIPGDHGPPATLADHPLMPLTHVRFPAAELVDAAEGTAAGLISLIGATWVMMQQSTVSTPRQVTGAGGSGRSWSREEREVTIVDLRRLAERAHEPDDGDRSREYLHRWYVRGHWRQQPVGPARSERRPTWISGYIKGPAGAPLLQAERVTVWRR